jgi:hypothetical protein
MCRGPGQPRALTRPRGPEVQGKRERSADAEGSRQRGQCNESAVTALFRSVFVGAYLRGSGLAARDGPATPLEEGPSYGERGGSPSVRPPPRIRTGRIR